MTSCSVLIPVYNGIKTVRAAIESAAAQADAVSEIIVVDNQSDDGTWEMLQSLQIPKLSLHRNPSNLGLFGNFNSCLEKAQGDVLVFLCADDRFYPRVLGECLAVFDRNPDLALLNAKGSAVDESGRKIKDLGAFLQPGIYGGREALEKLLLFYSGTGHNPFNYPGGVLMRRSCIQGMRFDMDMKRVGDIDFFYRALEKGSFASVPTLVCAITFHAQQEGRRRREETLELQECEAVVQKLNLDADLRQRINLNFKALGLWRGSLFLAQGARQGFLNHWRHAFSGQASLRVGAAFAAFVLRRLRMQVQSPSVFLHALVRRKAL